MHEKSKTEKGKMPTKSVLTSWGQVSFHPAWNVLRDLEVTSALPLGRWKSKAFMH